jgi:hypothetical protein
MTFKVFAMALDASKDVQIYRFDGKDWEYSRPQFFNFLNKTPETYSTFFERSFTKNNYGNLALITLSTLILYQYDRELINESQALGRRLGLGNEDNTKTMLSIGNESIFRGPTDLGSTLYFLGDGWVHGSIIGGFLIYGANKNDNRALQTGSQLAQGLLTGTLANQFLKRTTGRESPFRAENYKRGNWRFFPDQNKYNTDTSEYDAFPSGHVATAMMTFTVITENYPEYNHIMKPIQWSTIGLLSFQMMNNGVHWASDYPLSIGMGYLFGKIAVEQGRQEKRKDGATTSFKPLLTPQGTGILMTKTW